MRKLTMACLALLPSVAPAAEWEVVAHLTTGARIEIDAGSIMDADFGRIRAWFKETHPTPRALDFQQLLHYSEALRLYVFDCKKRRYGTLQAIFRNTSGDVIYQFSNRYPEMADVAPETAAEAMIDRVCIR